MYILICCLVPPIEEALFNYQGEDRLNEQNKSYLYFH